MSEQQTELVNREKINLTITTPRGVKFVEEADMLIMRCIDGDLGVLPRHEPVSTVLGEGILRIFNNGIEKKLAVFNGIVEINGTDVDIYTTIAQRPDEIDLERAEQDRREAEAALEAAEEVQMRSLQVTLRRSLVRIEVSLHLEDEETP
ncbi:ATP synthase F1 subunit epsilon [Amphibacillus xylanus]|uniref:ATP synthase epsilon chain n=1 Tax=Amphibacillus xylanus (strain ATCC 51415 / DSM 6626 / JCM 7361 / LMG 17667 / NBRC 15112 / Ep01) TaxID=698758 RepID=K0J7R1_AMPXN|nr:ATP synthase F1 subunit epsilon [Amphibacillus xylanus]BAM47808.1 putative F-type Na(+)-transporting ATPase subunit epsilon [Amphibacillus xylanus NBRC 15112]